MWPGFWMARELLQMTLQAFDIRRPVWCAIGSAGYIQAVWKALAWLAWERSMVGTMVGTVERRWGNAEHPALDVRLEDGSLELFWFHELDKASELNSVY